MYMVFYYCLDKIAPSDILLVSTLFLMINYGVNCSPTLCNSGVLAASS
jgi:hypothetical protein